jgi:hypothetical protein
MPEICRFYGIIIAMFFNDHAPPHFHARYGDYKASIRINDLTVIDGFLPPRALGFVIEWAFIHRKELAKNWLAAAKGKSVKPIKPLG